MAKTQQTNNGIFPGDTVIVYLDNYYGGDLHRHGMRRVKVERVTPSQAIIEGIRYNAHERTPMPVPDRFKDDDDYRKAGYRKFAHPQNVSRVEWDHLEAQLDRPEALERAKNIASAAYDVLGYEVHMMLPQILELSKDSTLMLNLENIVQETERKRRDALEDGRAFFARYAPTKEDQ